MITALYLPSAQLKQLLHDADADDVFQDIDGTLYLRFLVEETMQHIKNGVQIIRVVSILNPSERDV